MRVRWLCRKIPRRQITVIAGEFGYLVADGMTPAQSLQAGTSVAATLLGLSERVGALRPGMAADLVGVPSNPLDNIKVTQKRIIRDERRRRLQERQIVPGAGLAVGFPVLLEESELSLSIVPVIVVRCTAPARNPTVPGLVAALQLRKHHSQNRPVRRSIAGFCNDVGFFVRSRFQERLSAINHRFL